MRRHLHIPVISEDTLSGAEDFDGIVVGSEYCSSLIPDEEEIGEAAAWSASLSKELTVMVPYLREQQIKGVEGLIRGITRKVRPRLVVNDWGTMFVLSQAVPGADLVLGRLISGQKACVRIENSPFLTVEGKELLYNDLFSSEETRDYFRREFGIVSISVSSTPEKHLQAAPYTRMIHFPYILVTVTDYCPYRENLPSALISSCERICRKGHVVLSNESLGQVIYQRGRGRFFNPFPEGYEFPVTENAEIIVYDDVP